MQMAWIAIALVLGSLTCAASEPDGKEAIETGSLTFIDREGRKPPGDLDDAVLALKIRRDGTASIRDHKGKVIARLPRDWELRVVASASSSSEKHWSVVRPAPRQMELQGPMEHSDGAPWIVVRCECNKDGSCEVRRAPVGGRRLEAVESPSTSAEGLDVIVIVVEDSEDSSERSDPSMADWTVVKFGRGGLVVIPVGSTGVRVKVDAVRSEAVSVGPGLRDTDAQ